MKECASANKQMTTEERNTGDSSDGDSHEESVSNDVRPNFASLPSLSERLQLETNEEDLSTQVAAGAVLHSVDSKPSIQPTDQVGARAVRGINASDHPSEDEDGSASEQSSPETVIPLVQAELVVQQPIDAVVVTIDEDPDHAITFDPLEIEPTSSQSTFGNDKFLGFRSKRQYSLVFAVGLAILIVGVIFAIWAPIRLSSLKNNTSNHSNDGMTLPPSYPYECYTSSEDILTSQFRLPNETSKSEFFVFVICPNTVISIGNFKSPAQGNFEVTGGDYPLVVARDNVVIQCGLDGRKENNCTLDGGFTQVIMIQRIPFPGVEDFILVPSCHNTTLRGLTFTGELHNAGPFYGSSVTIAAKADNLRFEDCIWERMDVINGLIRVYDYFEDALDVALEGRIIDLTFSGCEFRYIFYDYPLIMVQNQTVVIEDSTFRGVTVSFLLQQQCSMWEETYAHGCAGLLWCDEGSSCSMKNVCMEDIDYQGPGIVYTIGDTETSFEGLTINDNTDNRTDVCEWASLTADGAPSCTSIFSYVPSCSDR